MSSMVQCLCQHEDIYANYPELPRAVFQVSLVRESPTTCVSQESMPRACSTKRRLSAPLQGTTTSLKTSRNPTKSTIHSLNGTLDQIRAAALVRVKPKFTVKNTVCEESSATTYGQSDCEFDFDSHEWANPHARCPRAYFCQALHVEQDERLRRRLLRVIGRLGSPDRALDRHLLSLPAPAAPPPRLSQSPTSSGLGAQPPQGSPLGEGSGSSGEQLDDVALHRLKGSDSYFLAAAVSTLTRIGLDTLQASHHPHILLVRERGWVSGEVLRVSGEC